MEYLNIFFDVLGCPKNDFYSEKTAENLSFYKCNIIDNPEKADIIIVFTCSFILNARKESIDEIFNLLFYKEFGKCKHLIVAGCLGDSHKEDLIKEIPEIDYILDFENQFKIWDNLLEKQLLNKEDIYLNDSTFTNRIFKNRAYSYVLISDGCNRNCSFCYNT